MRNLSGIRGVPFRKIVSRSYRFGLVIETLSCGHSLQVSQEKSFGATKRRCYSAQCKNGPAKAHKGE